MQAKTTEQYEAEIKALSAEHSDEISLLKEIHATEIEALENKLKSAAAGGFVIPATPVEVTFNKKKYAFSIPKFRLSGHKDVISSEEAATDEDVLKEILQMEGQTILKELV